MYVSDYESISSSSQHGDNQLEDTTVTSTMHTFVTENEMKLALSGETRAVPFERARTISSGKNVSVSAELIHSVSAEYTPSDVN